MNGHRNDAQDVASARAWSGRPVASALTPERLAALIDRTQDRYEGRLFTATPAEELDDIGRWQRLSDLAWAGQVRAVVAACNRADASAREFVADEAALAMGVSPTTGAGFVTDALHATSLPGLLEAVENGTLTERHVKAVLRELWSIDLTLEQRQAVVLVLLARYQGEFPGQVAALTRRLVLTIDRAAAMAREQKAARDRRVRFFPGVDGQATVWAQGPAAMVAAIRASLDATLPLEPDAEDDRSTDERTFDLFVELLTGGATCGEWTASVIVPFSTLDGGDLELAEIPGLGPVLPETARDLAVGCASFTQVAVDAETGTVLSVGEPLRPDAVADRLATPPAPQDLGTANYRIPRRLRRLIQHRDRTCVFPGCQRPAAATDLDHAVPWPRGKTDQDNLHCLCRHHHRAKQAVFTVERSTDGATWWTTRGGWRFRRPPPHY